MLTMSGLVRDGLYGGCSVSPPVYWACYPSSCVAQVAAVPAVWLSQDQLPLVHGSVCVCVCVRPCVCVCVCVSPTCVYPCSAIIPYANSDLSVPSSHA